MPCGHAPTLYKFISKQYTNRDATMYTSKIQYHLQTPHLRPRRNKIHVLYTPTVLYICLYYILLLLNQQTRTKHFCSISPMTDDSATTGQWARWAALVNSLLVSHPVLQRLEPITQLESYMYIVCDRNASMWRLRSTPGKHGINAYCAYTPHTTIAFCIS